MDKAQESSLSVQGSKVLITATAMIASLMAVLDISIVNVAINDIRASFGVQMDQIAWISTGYMMANVIVIPLTGWFQARFGLRNYFVFSVLLFTFASILCAMAWNLPSLTIFRIFQGAGGGAIIPTASVILMSRYPREQQGMAQAFIGLGAITGPLLGPTLGGYLINSFSWHMIFLINIPFGLLSACIAYKHIKIPKFTPSQSPLDVKGLALLIFGLGALQFVLEEGNRDDWFNSPLIVFWSIISFVSLVTLVVHMLETENPMINFRVFFNRNYFLCTVVNLCLGVTLFSASFLYSLFCGSVLDYAPLDIGLLFLKGCFIQVFLMPLVGKIVPFVDNRILIVLGITTIAISLWFNASLTQQATNHDLILVLFIRSLGLAFVFIPLSVIAVGNIDNKNLGNAVGLFNLTRELGGSIGLAVMSTLLVNRIKLYDHSLKVYLHSGNAILQEQMSTLKNLFFGRVFDANSAANLQLQNRVTLQATVKAFSLGFEDLSLLFCVAVLLVFLMKKNKHFNPDALKDLH